MLSEHDTAMRVKHLSPGCFAIVMATGIVSIDLSQNGMPWLARVLLALNGVMYVWLLMLSAWRLLAWPQAVHRDFSNPSRGAAFLTIAAATLVLSSQCLAVVHWPIAAMVLAGLGASFWLVLIYLLMAYSIIARTKASLADRISGIWLVAVVATQAVSVVGSQLGGSSPVLLFASLCLYMLGAALYLMVITFVIYRMVFMRMRASDFTPPYWINMGALAITTLAGSELVLNTPATGPMTELLPFIKGFSVFSWATASGWIPLLVILEIWRHAWRHVSLRYETDDWDIVFPIGMYSVSTHGLAQAIGVDFLAPIPAAGVYLGLAAWLVVGISGLLHAVSRKHRSR